MAGPPPPTRTISNTMTGICNMYRLRATDGIRVVFIVLVFLALAFCDANVQGCFFPSTRDNQKQLINSIPLGLGLLATLVFMFVPHTKKGIGYGDDSKVIVPDMETLRGGRPHWTYTEINLHNCVCITIH